MDSFTALARLGKVEELQRRLVDSASLREIVNTCLLHACKAGQFAVVAMLLDNSCADVFYQSPSFLKSKTPMQVAVTMNHLDVLQMLLLVGRWTLQELLNARDASCLTTLTLAIKSNRINMVQALVDAAGYALITEEALRASAATSQLAAIRSFLLRRSAAHSINAVVFPLLPKASPVCIYALDREINERKDHCVRFGWMRMRTRLRTSRHSSEGEGIITRVCFKLHSTAASAAKERSMLATLVSEDAEDGAPGSGSGKFICNLVAREELFVFTHEGTLPAPFSLTEEAIWHGLALEKGKCDLQYYLCDGPAPAGPQPLSATVLASISRQMIEIVAFIHSQKFAWLDVKLQNFVVMFDRPGDADSSPLCPRIKAIDLAGCLPLGESVSIESITFTVKFAAPELGQLPASVVVEEALDFWALGLALLQGPATRGAFLPALERHFFVLTGLDSGPSSHANHANIINSSAECYLSDRYYKLPGHDAFARRFDAFLCELFGVQDSLDVGVSTMPGFVDAIRRECLQVDTAARRRCSLARLAHLALP